MGNNFIGERVTSLRLAKGISEYNLSKNIGKCNNYINKVTSGSILPSLGALTHICDYFGITLQQFFSDDLKHVPLKIARIHALLPELTDEQLDSLLIIIHSMKGGEGQEEQISQK